MLSKKGFQPEGNTYRPPWTDAELSFLNDLTGPDDIQKALLSMEYDPDNACRSPRYVLREGKAHCFEGAIFAAACLRHLGHRPLLVDLRSENDDDHVLAVYRENGCWGSLSKSNFSTLGSREPVYRSVRELVMSYFDLYFNTLGEKTLRAYSLPLDLRRFDAREWMTTHEDLEYIGDHLDRARHFPLVSESMVGGLNRVDDRLLEAGLVGVNRDGLFVPKTR